MLGKKSKEISVETEGTADLFHSCRRCDCNANSLHPSHSEKTVWKEGAAEMHHMTYLHLVWAKYSSSKTIDGHILQYTEKPNCNGAHYALTQRRRVGDTHAK